MSINFNKLDYENKKQKTKNKKLLSNFFYLLFAFTMSYSCDSEKETGTINAEVNTTGEELNLGEKRDNPYTVENMQKAYNSLKSSDENITSIDIKATHLYVRFLPENVQEYDSLVADTTLKIFPFPLDYQILNEGSRYHDPSLPDSSITYQYCVVPIDFTFPEIKYEILANLYLKDEKTSYTKSGDIYSQIEEESLRLTNNLGSSLKSSDWNPSGTVTTWDDELYKYLPVKGAKVRVYSWFKVRDMRTGVDGKFYCDTKYSGDVHYEVKWERDDYWDIRDGNWGQAYTKGPEKVGAWTCRINENMNSLYFATAHRAAYRYHFENTVVARPPDVKISVDFEEMGDYSGRYLPYINWYTLPEVKIFTEYNGGGRINTIEFYKTVAHELGHASNWNFAGKGEWAKYIVANIKTYQWTVEGYAVAVGWEICGQEYGKENAWIFSFGYQSWSKTTGDKYSPMIVDLIDNNNQINSCADAQRWGYLDDKISGYTFSEIENCLKTGYSKTDFLNNLKSKYDYPSREALLDNYFLNFQ